MSLFKQKVSKLIEKTRLKAQQETERTQQLDGRPTLRKVTAVEYNNHPSYTYRSEGNNTQILTKVKLYKSTN